MDACGNGEIDSTRTGGGGATGGINGGSPAGSEGDREFMQRVMAMVSRCRRLAYAMLRDHHDVEDCLQKARLQAWQYLPTLAGMANDRVRAAAVKTIVIRTALRIIKRRKKWFALAPLKINAVKIVPDGDAPDPAKEAERKEQWQRVLDALELLRPEDRVVIVLYFLGESLTLQEIAKILGVSTTTVYNRKERGLEELRDYLGVGEDQGPSDHPEDNEPTQDSKSGNPDVEAPDDEP